MLVSCLTRAQGNDVITSYKEINDTLVISFINTGNDTLQLFSTYFEKPYIFSKVLHKVDAKNKKYKVSFLPLLPYLSGYLTDKLILTDVNKITMVGQNLYSFREILPKNQIYIKLPLSQLFGNVNAKNNVVKDYNNETINGKKLKKITLSKQKGKFEMLFEFAFYKEVNLIVKRDLYIKSGIKAYEQAKNYEIVKLPVSLEKDIPLILIKSPTCQY